MLTPTLTPTQNPLPANLTGAITKFFSEGVGKRTDTIVAHVPGSFLHGEVFLTEQLVGALQALVLQVFEDGYAKKLLEVFFEFEVVEADTPG